MASAISRRALAHSIALESILYGHILLIVYLNPILYLNTGTLLTPALVNLIKNGSKVQSLILTQVNIYHGLKSIAYRFKTHIK